MEQLTDKQRADNVKVWLNALSERDDVHPDIWPKFRKGVSSLYNKLHNQYCCLGVACRVLPQYLGMEGDNNNYNIFPNILGISGHYGTFKDDVLIQGAPSLVKLNDQARFDDKDFSVMRMLILANVDLVFSPGVAAILHETMKEDISKAVEEQKKHQDFFSEDNNC